MSSLIADTSRHQAHQAAIPQRRAALIAGLAYVLLTGLALFAIRVLDGSTQPDNPAATVEHIVNSKALFRSGLPAFFIVLIADVVVAWAHYGFFLALVFFGVHLLLLGFVMVKSDDAPSILGMLVALAGLGYVVINLARVVLPDYRDYENLLLLLLAVLAVPGEFGLVGWLLWRGGKARPAAVSTPPVDRDLAG